jgi:hypothetical protein
MILEETYSDVHLLIYKITHRISIMYNYPFDDLIGEANRQFVKIFDKYDTSKGTKFSTWLAFKLSFNLRNYLNLETPHRFHAEFTPEIYDNPDSFGVPLPPFFVPELKLELSPDAVRVVDLVLMAPDAYSSTCRWNKAKTPLGVRQSLREHLLDIGWSSSRIDEAFKEITNSIKHNDQKA